MTSFLLSVINISFTATIVAVAVILLRFLFKRTPRWITCLLWGLVGLRLVFPFAIQSKFSVIPSVDLLTVNSAAQSSESLKVHTGINTLNHTVNNQISSLPETDKLLEITDVLAIVWVSVAALVLIYGIISYIMMYLRVRTAIPLRKNIYQSENVKSPFVLGFIKPKIYIPFNITGRTLKYVLAHEEAHIKRMDHIVKPFAYLLLCFHWFNPLMWLSYILLCRDIEVACDEKVIKNYSINKRKNYAFALLDCKVNRSHIAVCPVAFGEVNVSDRIKKTLCYKKPAMWAIAAAISVLVIASGCLLTNPKAESYHTEVTPAVEITVPAETETAPIVNDKVVTQIKSETTPEATDPEEVLTETQPLTESAQEYYYEPVYTEAYTEAYIPTEAYEPLEEVAEETKVLIEGEEYYYYEYDENPKFYKFETLEIEPVTINPEDYTPLFEGYSIVDINSFSNSLQQPTFPVIPWAVNSLDDLNSINSYSVW